MRRPNFEGAKFRNIKIPIIMLVQANSVKENEGNTMLEAEQLFISC